MMLLIPILQKARKKSPRLVPKTITAIRNGKSYQTVVWVLPGEAKSNKPTKGGQFGLFDDAGSSMPSGDVQLDLFSEAANDWQEKVVSTIHKGTKINFTTKNGDKKTGEVKFLLGGAYRVFDGTEFFIIGSEQVTDILPEKDPKKIAKAIKKVTPETRTETSAILNGASLEGKAEEELKPYAFEPGTITQVMPSGNEFTFIDYRGIDVSKIGLIPQKGILEKEKPSWLPELSDKNFAYNRNRVDAVKVANNDYIIRNTDNKDVEGYRVNAELFAIMQDYYIKRAKQTAQNKYDKMVEQYGEKRVRKPSVRVLSADRATNSHYNATKQYIKEGESVFGILKETYSDLKQKSVDLKIQIEEDLSAHSRGRKTSYGDGGTKSDLYEDYGVLVKRQNGDVIQKQEITEIKEALDSVFEVFGDRSSMAKAFGLKISHSGEVLQHASKASGIYFPYYKAIGVTAKHGQDNFGFTLSHEWAHFIDNYLGTKGKRNTFASDDWSSLPGKIANTFRDNMKSNQGSGYQTRTCECFARAFEQYFATKTGKAEQYQETHNFVGNHPNQKKFEEKVQPLIEQFFRENNEMLKALI